MSEDDKTFDDEASSAPTASAAFFAEHRERADFEAFDRIMSRQGGLPPKSDDIL